jgi:rubredoxin
MHEGRECKATTIIWVAPHEGPFTLRAGPEGLRGLSLHFPRPDAARPPREEIGSTAGQAPEHKVWQCALCAFVYDEAQGLPGEGLPPGTRWADVPEDWGCPDCSAKKADFRMVEI